MLEHLRRANAAASAALIQAGAAGLVLMTAIIGWQVFGRFVLGSSPAWAEQAALILMIWYVFFAAAAGVREGFHIRILALQSAMPATARARHAHPCPSGRGRVRDRAGGLGRASWWRAPGRT
jgi:TRAP-type C4-dicarboxylate transport system permease small subunit